MASAWARRHRPTESVTGAARHVLDGAGHMPHMERPAEVQAAIEEAMARAG